MSVEYQFNKRIKLSEIESKTDLKIVEHDGEKFLIDHYGNSVHISQSDYDYVYELWSYGLNNSTYIRDSLVRVFGVKFIIDNEEMMFYYEPELLSDSENLYDVVMVRYGYGINDDGSVIIPDRDDEDYYPFRSDVNEKRKESGEDGDDEDGLPF